MTRFNLVAPVAAAAIAALALTGCGHTPAAGTSPGYTQLASMQVAPADRESTPRYKIDISYPLLPESAATLAAALQQTGSSAKQAFLQGLPDPDEQPQYANRQLQFKLDFSVVARSPRFISVREKGWADTGGAHPIPVDAALVYDRQADQLVALGDLFTNPQQARERLAQYARDMLQQRLLADVPTDASAKARQEWLTNMGNMIAQGTAPTADNYRSFIVLTANDAATGLRLVFSAYQVAPYVFGAQMVDVPVAVFASLLKPQYRSAFTTARPSP